MKATNTPERIWDYGVVHQANIRKFLPQDKLRDRTVMDHAIGKTLDISEYCAFDLYNLVWYHPGLQPNFNDENRTLGQWLGIFHVIGSDICVCVFWSPDPDGMSKL